MCRSGWKNSPGFPRMTPQNYVKAILGSTCGGGPIGAGEPMHRGATSAIGSGLPQDDCDLAGLDWKRLPSKRLLHPLDQLHRTRRRADFAFVDHIGEHVARRLLRLCLVDLWQVVGFAALGPELQAPGPGIELFWRIAGLEVVIALLQAGIDKIGGDVGDRRVGAMLGE